MNRFTKLSFLLFCFAILVFENLCGQTLEEGFLDPPMSAKPKAYWVLVNGNFSLSAMTKEIKDFKEKGLGGLDIWDISGWVDPNKVVPAGPQFMGEESTQAIAHGIREGKKLGMEMGLTISSSWNVGGHWVTAEDGVMGLFSTTDTIEGPTTYDKKLDFPEIPEKFNESTPPMLLYKDENGLPTFYKEVALMAVKIEKDSKIIDSENSIDLSPYLNDGVLKWEVPPGQWKVVRYITTGTGQPLMRPSPNSNGLVVDHFAAEPMQRSLDFFIGKLKAELGEDLGESGLSYLYTDSYEANSANWTLQLPKEFEKRNGYMVERYLPALDGYIVDNPETTERFLFDFNKTLSDLIIENHYEYGTKVCKEHGLGFVAEAGGPGPPIHNIPFETIKALGSLSMPRGEFWYDPSREEDFIDQLQIVKAPASAAHLYNLPTTEAEAFTGTQIWQFGPGDLKAATDRALCEGLTRFVYHTSPHTPPESGDPGWVYNFGTLMNTTRSWWPKSANFHGYIGRSSYLLQQGDFVGDVLFYYGDDAPNFADPVSRENELGSGYDYDIINSDVILNRLEVENGYFKLPHGPKYKVLVLPDAEAMNPDVLEKLENLVKQGGILLGNAPTRSHSLQNFNENDLKVTELAALLWKGSRKKNNYGEGKVFSRKNTILEVLQEVGIVPNMKTNLIDQDSKVDYIHRDLGDKDIYFISNKTNSSLSFDCSLRTTKGMPETWNPVTRDISQQPIFLVDAKTTTFPLELPPNGSMFVVFQNKVPERQVTKIVHNGEQLFPGLKQAFPLSVTNKSWTLAKEGNYELYSESDKLSEIEISDIPEAKKIEGAWEVRFPFGWDAPQSTQFKELISWTDSKDEGIKYFSGIAAYHKSFELSEEEIADHRITLNLGKVSKVADVYLNGQQIDVLWSAPFSVDISKAVRKGKNYLVVEVANVLNNRMVGDAQPNSKKRTHTNITKAPNAWEIPYEEAPLIQSGLLGPVTITFAKTIENDN